MPKVDEDGNDVAGIRLPAVQVPVGTFTGWNLRPRGLAEGELAGLLGSFIPFAKTKAQRRRNRDPRPSFKNATITVTTTFSNSATPREAWSSKDICCRTMPRELLPKQKKAVYRNHFLKIGGYHVTSPAWSILVLSPCPPSPGLPRSSSKTRAVRSDHEFAVTGGYEKLVGKAYGEVDPKTKHNKNIVNLDKTRNLMSEAGSNTRWIFLS